MRSCSENSLIQSRDREGAGDATRSLTLAAPDAPRQSHCHTWVRPCLWATASEIAGSLECASLLARSQLIGLAIQRRQQALFLARIYLHQTFQSQIPNPAQRGWASEPGIGLQKEQPYPGIDAILRSTLKELRMTVTLPG